MSQLAKMVRTASPKPQQTDNEKYAMRCWMLRLGFIGDEFATAREILLRNMEGNASWRYKEAGMHGHLLRGQPPLRW